MKDIYWALILAPIILLAIGLLLGLGLAIAAKILYVKEDERIGEVEKRLPGYNCGSCGYAGCRSMAEAIVGGKEPNVKKCRPGKDDKNFIPIAEYLKDHPNDDGSVIKVNL